MYLYLVDLVCVVFFSILVPVKILLTKKNQAIDIGNYQNFGLSVRDSKDQNIPESVFKALNSVAEIEDNRALYY